MPNSGGVHHTLAGLHIRRGDLDLALAAAEKEIFGFFRLQDEAIIYHAMGDGETAQIKLQELIDEYGDDASVQAAAVYASWGDVDETFAALERGFAIRDPGLVYIKGASIFTELLKDDPRWDDFLDRMNLQ
jgi:tetratricopeptide (TPR) repeat protein